MLVVRLVTVYIPGQPMLVCALLPCRLDVEDVVARRQGMALVVQPIPDSLIPAGWPGGGWPGGVVDSPAVPPIAFNCAPVDLWTPVRPRRVVW